MCDDKKTESITLKLSAHLLAGIFAKPKTGSNENHG